MTVRTFDWRGLPALYRFRNQCLFLDSTRLLTQGPRLLPLVALFAQLGSATGTFTFYARGESKQVLLGQVNHLAGKTSARLSFLTPFSGLDSDTLPLLVEYITRKMGERGAYNLLAEVSERDQAMEALRKAGLGVYARQRVWQLTGQPLGEARTTPWKPGSSRDIISVRSLYCNLVPGLVQQMEPPPNHRVNGLVYRDGDEVLAYIEVKYGPRGIWVQPFIHPDAEKVPDRMVHLMQNIPFRRSRPVYICIRTYQSWLEPALEDLGAEPGPRQAVMVKRLAVMQKAARLLTLPALEGRQPEVTASITQTKSN